MPSRTIRIAALSVWLLAMGGCSISNPLSGAAVPGSTHGGWGAPRSETEAPVATAQQDSTAQEEQEPIAEAAPPSRNEAPSVPSRTTSREERPTPRPATPEPTTQPTASAPSPSSSSAYSNVTRVSFAERSDGRGLVVRMHASGPIPAYRVEEVSENRLQLTLFQTGIASSARRDDPLRPVRSYEVNGSGERTVVTFDVEPGTFYERQPYPDRDSDDLLLPLTHAPAPVVAAAPVRNTSAPVASPNGSAPDMASREHWRMNCIVIDAGHGGHDPGAVQNGVREKDITLSVSRKVGRLVEEELGISVVYTRRDDRFIELAERGRIANESCGKLFVSIHVNSAANRRAQGTETFFLGPARTESARRVMERENSVIALESDPSLYSGMDDAALIMQTMAQSTYQRMSETLASRIEGEFVSRASRNSRGVKQAGFLVLWRASMPAVLVEMGFLSNPEEARYLASTRGQDEMARAILEGIRAYKKEYDRNLGFATN